MGTTITFKRPDGKDASGYLANASRGNAPGVVVIQEWWGLQDQIKGMCDRFALAGFNALAPDLYKGTVVPYHDTEAAGREMNSLDFMDATTQTVRGAVQYLARNGAKVGLTGFCLGGAGTILGAAKIPELAAGVVFYGIPPEQAAKPAAIQITLQAHFGHKDAWSTPELGRLEDAKVLGQAARAAAIVVNAASADHKGAVVALLDALAGSGKPLIQTSGSSIIGTRAGGERSDAVFDEDTPFTPSPARVARVALNELILSYRDKGCRPVIICPSLIYGQGLGAGPDSVQVPFLIRLAKNRGNAAHAGPGENIWSNVHIDDLVTLYALAIEKAPAGAFYFVENGENSMRELCVSINRTLGFAGPPSAMTMKEAAAEWGEGT